MSLRSVWATEGDPIFKNILFEKEDWGSISVVGYLPDMCKDLGSIPSTAKTKTKTPQVLRTKKHP
jgi:hypothetical protein